MDKKLNRFDKHALDNLRLNEDGAPNLVRLLTEDLFESTPGRLASIKTCIITRDWERAALEVHALKSSIRTMGGMLAGEFVVDLDLFYFSDTMTYSTSSAYKRTFYDFMIGFPVTKKKSFIIGWNYDGMTFSDDQGSGATTLAVTDMGPKFAYYFDKNREWVAAFTYNLITKGTYTPSGGTATELRGSSMRFEAGYTPQMWENVLIGAKIVWYKGAFKEEITNETTLTQVSYDRTVIYPAFALTFRWD